MMQSSLVSSNWRKALCLALVGLVLIVTPTTVTSEKTKLRTDTTSTTATTSIHHTATGVHRHAQGGTPTEVLYLNIMRVDRTPEFDEGGREYYNVRARVRVVNQSGTGLNPKDIINFVSYIIPNAGTESPVLVRDDSCIFAKLIFANGRYLLGDGNASLQYVDRDVCWIHEFDLGLIGQIIVFIVKLFVPGLRQENN